MSNFPKGAFFNLPHPNAPDFVKGQINITNKNQFIDWLKSQPGENVKLSLKVNRDGKGYAELDTYKKEGAGQQPQPVDRPAQDQFNDEDLPF